MRIRTGKLRMSAQNAWYSQPGVYVPSVLTISGRYFLDAGATAQTLTWANFIAKTQSDVEAQLQNALADIPRLRANTRGIIIMDIEGTADGLSAHPKDLHLLAGADLTNCISAWKTRFAAARAVFPNAKLGFYGMPIPHGRGLVDNATYIARLAALVTAGTTLGGAAFDGLDYLIPVCYSEFGPNDNLGAWTSYYAMTKQAVTGAQSILKSNGSSLRILALIGGYISNGGSVDNGIALLDLATPDPLGSTWAEQFRAFRDYGCDEVAFWNGQNSRYVKDGNGLTTHLVASMIHAGRGWF